MPLMRRDTGDVLREFDSIKGQAKQLRQSMKDSLFGPSDELENLVEAFKDAKLHFGQITSEQQIGVYLRDIELKGRDYSAVYKQKALLQEIDGECDKAIAALEKLATTVSKDDSEKLETLKTQLEALSEDLPGTNYELSLHEALTAYERGAYLSSALIASRVILHALNHIRGDFIEVKVQFLHDKGRIGNDLKEVQESLIKANRMAKKFFSDDITVVPSSSEALTLLGDAMRLAALVSTF